MDELECSKPRCRICEKEIKGVVYIVRDEDPYGNPIPNAYIILCKKCKKKWDEFDDENVRMILTSKYREKLVSNGSGSIKVSRKMLKNKFKTSCKKIYQKLYK